MYKIYRSFLLIALPLLAFMATGCMEDEEEYVDTHPRLAQVSPVRGKPGTVVMISGRNLADINSVKFGDAEATIVKTTADSVYVTVPNDAETGNQPLRLSGPQGTSVITFEVQGALELPSYMIFNEGLNSTWQIWGGWGGVTSDANNSENPLQGAGVKNLKISWAEAWGGFQLHPTVPDPFSLASYSRIMVSVKGGAGMNGKKVFLFIKNKAGVEGPKKEIVLTQDYVSYSIPLSQLGNPADINELNFQNEAAGTVIYVDAYGLD